MSNYWDVNGIIEFTGSQKTVNREKEAALSWIKNQLGYVFSEKNTVSFLASGEASIDFDDDLRKMLASSKHLSYANLRITHDDLYFVRYIWTKESGWQFSEGEVVYDTDEAEKLFGISKSHQELAEAFVKLVNMAYPEPDDRMKALDACGCSRELAQLSEIECVYDSPIVGKEMIQHPTNRKQT